jgi:anti-sigma B factor antagonist
VIAAAACSNCPTLVIERGERAVVPASCPACSTRFAEGARSRRPDGGPVAFVVVIDQGAIVGLQGEIDLFARDALRDAFDKALETDPPALVVDLAEVTFADSTALAALVRGRRLAGERPMVTVVPEGRVRRVFAIAGLDDELGVAGSRGEALEALFGRAGDGDD